METSDLQVGRKAVLVVLFIPSVERDGITSIDQDYWVTEALRTFGLLLEERQRSHELEGYGATTKWGQY